MILSLVDPPLFAGMTVNIINGHAGEGLYLAIVKNETQTFRDGFE